MVTTPENHGQILLPQAELDAQFARDDMLAHFQNTCNPHSVKVTAGAPPLPVLGRAKRPSWEFMEFRSKSDNAKQCKLRVRNKVIEGEQEYHVVWYKAKTGEIFVVDNLDITLLGF